MIVLLTKKYLKLPYQIALIFTKTLLKKKFSGKACPLKSWNIAWPKVEGKTLNNARIRFPLI